MSRVKTVSNSEKKFLLKCLSEWKRFDGRAFDEFRPVEIKFGKDLGCCHVSLGKTQVLAQVSCEIQEPKSSRPSEGVLQVNLELNPIASPEFEIGRPSETQIQLNRLLEKCLKDSKAVDLESLCIKVKEKVWAVRVDVNVLNHEGNILDCASIAALTALTHFKRPDVTCDGEEFTIHSYKQRDPIPIVIHHYPVCITFAIFNGGEHILADPSLDEEGVADAYLTMNLNSYKELCGLHLGGQAELTPQVILQTTYYATKRANTAVQLIKDSIEADTKLREEKGAVGFHHSIDLEHVEVVKELVECLDVFSMQKNKKKKKKHLKNQENGAGAGGGEDEVKEFGPGSAVALPKQVWISSDEEMN